MGTTIVAALVDGDRIVIAHVGDSRAYVLRGGQLLQMTEDDTWLACCWRLARRSAPRRTRCGTC